MNLIEFCEKTPELANSVILDVGNHPYIYDKVLKCVPYALFTRKAFSSKNINRVITISGTVIRANETLIKNITRELLCLKCNDRMHAERTSRKKKEDLLCKSCGSSLLKDKKNFEKVIQSQRVRLQDIGNSGIMSETFEVIFEGKFAGKFVPGDRLLVTGVVLVRWKPFRSGEQAESSIYMHALSVLKQDAEFSEFSPEKIHIDSIRKLSRFEKRAFLIFSFAKEIHGFENVKLGLLLALVSGGNNSERKDGARSNSHVLLIGDPSTGKSHLLKACAKLVSPVTMVNGIGTTQAGLTSCAMRQGREWVLEAGALVLADMGVCCIDEFNKLKVNEKNGLLEAMEQQTLSVAKAGMVSSLNTRCSVIAVSGMRRKYDTGKSISENIMITTPLVGRFDLVFGLFDDRNRESDSLIADKILCRKPERSLTKKPVSSYWSNNELRRYVSTIRRSKTNVVPKDLNEILLGYYHGRRKMDGINELNTIRMLESLVRLTEAHSKLLGSDVVVIDDVYTAILLLETALNSKSSISIDPQRIFIDEGYYNETVPILGKIYWA